MKKGIHCSLMVSLLLLNSMAQTGTEGIIFETDEESVLDIETTPESELPSIDKIPELITFVEATYPSELVKQGIGGDVLLELLVNESGGVDSAVVVRGIHPVLDSSAAEAARSFKFRPAMADGDSVAVLLQYEYHFSIHAVVDSVEVLVNFQGVLLESGTRKPVPDAVVAISFVDTLSDSTLPIPFRHYLQKLGTIPGQHFEEEKLVTTTDSLGVFRFFSLPACTIDVQVIVAGYENYQTREKIPEKEELSAKYYIRKHSYSALEIVVYGKAEEKEVSRRELTVKEIRKIPGLGGDAVKVVQTMPGVARPLFGSGEIVVRGAPSWDSRFILDGVGLPVLYHFGGLKSVYNSEALESIDFYPGGFGTRYGGAIAGIIELESRAPHTDRFHTMLDISSVDGSFMIEGPINNKTSILLSGRRSFIGDLLSLATKQAGDQFPFTISPFYWDYLCKTQVAFSKNNSVSLTLFGSRDSLAFIMPDLRIGSEEISSATDRMGMNSTFHMGILQWELMLGEHWKNHIQFAATKFDQRFSMFGFVKVDAEMWVNHLREQLTYTFNNSVNINIGVDAELLWDDLIMVMYGSKNQIMRDTSENWLFGVVGGYLNLEWKPLENLLIIPGLRYDYFPELQYDGSILPAFWNYSSFNNERGYSGEPSLRLNARYEFIKNHTIKAALGNYSQTPEPMGQVIHKTWGDPKMPSTKATHFVSGYEWQITDLISADAQMYLNNQWNIPEFAQGSNMSNQGGGDVLWLDNGRGRMYGLELMLRHQQSERFFGWLTYTLSRSERYDHNRKEWTLYGDDETHHIQLLGNWHLKREWDLGFRLRYVTGKPTTPIVGVIENERINGSFSFAPVPGEPNSTRVDPFFQLDLRMDKKFVFNKWMFSFYLDLQNISWFLYKSPEFELYNFDYSDKMTVTTFPMIALGYRAEF